MSTTITSSSGSNGENSGSSWSSRVPADTSAAAAALELQFWSGLSPAQRAQWWQRRQKTFLEMRLGYLQKCYPQESRRELIARAVEERYGRELPPAFLQRALEAIRSYEPPEETR